MVIDEKFAKYILSLQSIAKLERGLDENYDIPFRDKLEDTFPNLKEKRERRIKELDAKKEKYYNLFYDNTEIKKEYKLLKTIKKLSG